MRRIITRKITTTILLFVVLIIFLADVSCAECPDKTTYENYAENKMEIQEAIRNDLGCLLDTSRIDAYDAAKIIRDMDPSLIFGLEEYMKTHSTEVKSIFVAFRNRYPEIFDEAIKTKFELSSFKSNGLGEYFDGVFSFGVSVSLRDLSGKSVEAVMDDDQKCLKIQETLFCDDGGGGFISSLLGVLTISLFPPEGGFGSSYDVIIQNMTPGYKISSGNNGDVRIQNAEGLDISLLSPGTIKINGNSVTTDVQNTIFHLDNRDISFNSDGFLTYSRADGGYDILMDMGSILNMPDVVFNNFVIPGDLDRQFKVSVRSPDLNTVSYTGVCGDKGVCNKYPAYGRGASDDETYYVAAIEDSFGVIKTYDYDRERIERVLFFDTGVFGRIANYKFQDPYYTAENIVEDITSWRKTGKLPTYVKTLVQFNSEGRVVVDSSNRGTFLDYYVLDKGDILFEYDEEADDYGIVRFNRPTKFDLVGFIGKQIIDCQGISVVYFLKERGEIFDNCNSVSVISESSKCHGQLFCNLDMKCSLYKHSVAVETDSDYCSTKKILGKDEAITLGDDKTTYMVTNDSYILLITRSDVDTEELSSADYVEEIKFLLSTGRCVSTTLMDKCYKVVDDVVYECVKDSVAPDNCRTKHSLDINALSTMLLQESRKVLIESEIKEGKDIDAIRDTQENVNTRLYNSVIPIEMIIGRKKYNYAIKIGDNKYKIPGTDYEFSVNEDGTATVTLDDAVVDPSTGDVARFASADNVNVPTTPVIMRPEDIDDKKLAYMNSLADELEILRISNNPRASEVEKDLINFLINNMDFIKTEQDALDYISERGDTPYSEEEKRYIEEAGSLPYDLGRISELREEYNRAVDSGDKIKQLICLRELRNYCSKDDTDCYNLYNSEIEDIKASEGEQLFNLKETMVSQKTRVSQIPERPAISSGAIEHANELVEKNLGSAKDEFTNHADAELIATMRAIRVAYNKDYDEEIWVLMDKYSPEDLFNGYVDLKKRQLGNEAAAEIQAEEILRTIAYSYSSDERLYNYFMEAASISTQSD
ncbi:hypothetical protein DRJ17_04935 [Candidatus Woesearchaeota archaeon]|nr:MAG: hypothetical protein DRJ17_04935 [Candidatus Woesearchaeota archaeon]